MQPIQYNPVPPPPPAPPVLLPGGFPTPGTGEAQVPTCHYYQQQQQPQLPPGLVSPAPQHQQQQQRRHVVQSSQGTTTIPIPTGLQAFMAPAQVMGTALPVFVPPPPPAPPAHLPIVQPQQLQVTETPAMAAISALPKRVAQPQPHQVPVQQKQPIPQQKTQQQMHAPPGSVSSSQGASSRRNNTRRVLTASDSGKTLSELALQFIADIGSLQPEGSGGSSSSCSLRVARCLALDDLSYMMNGSQQARDLRLKFEVYGSARTGLMVPSSDLDVAILLGGGGGKKNQNNNNHNNKSSSNSNSTSKPGGGGDNNEAPGFKQMKNLLYKNSSLFTIDLVLRNARFPVIKCRHTDTNTHFDFCFSDEGVASSDYLLKELRSSNLGSLVPPALEPGSTSTADSSEPLPHRVHARNLIILVKHLLHYAGHRSAGQSNKKKKWKQHSHPKKGGGSSGGGASTEVVNLKKLDDPSQGGLGGFGVSLMVIFFCDSVLKPRHEAARWSDLGFVLTQFLVFYGRDFDHTEFGIDFASQTQVQKILPALSEDGVDVNGIRKQKHQQLVIHNPLQAGKNAVQACHKFHGFIKPYFAELGSALSSAIQTPAVAPETFETYFGDGVGRTSASPGQGGGHQNAAQPSESFVIELENRMKMFTVVDSAGLPSPALDGKDSRGKRNRSPVGRNDQQKSRRQR